MLTHDPDSLTRTEWRVSEYSEPFITAVKGRCLFSGQPFARGATVRKVRLEDGTVGYLDRHGPHGAVWAANGIWWSNMCMNMAKLPDYVEHPEMRQITLFNRDGMPMRFTQRAVDGSWLKNERTIVSAAQFAAWAKKSVGFQASRSVTFLNQPERAAFKRGRSRVGEALDPDDGHQAPRR